MSTKETVMQRNTQSTRVRTLAACGMFAAIAAVLMFIEFPLPIAPSFYKLDFSEVPVMIGTFCYGPIAGIAIEFIKIAVKTVIKGTQTQRLSASSPISSSAALLLCRRALSISGRRQRRARSWAWH